MSNSKKSCVALLAYISRTGADDFFYERENTNMNEFVLWTYKIGNASKQMIRDQINSEGEVAFYVYVSEGSGSGAVKVVAHFDDFEEAEGTELYEGVPLEGMFRFTRYRWLDQPLQLNDFVNWNTGNTIEHPSWLRSHFLYVQDPFGKAPPATTGRKKRQHQMIREAAESIEGIVSREYILDFISKKYPKTKPSSIGIVINAFTVNNQNRIGSFPENHYPRIYDERYDILYQPVQGKAEYELYDPKKHGEWVIAKTKSTPSNPRGLEVKLAAAPSTASKARGASKARARQHLSRVQIEELIKAFRGFMSTYEGVLALKRRKLDEPDQVNDIIKKAKEAQRKGNWKVFLPLVYNGILPSRKRKSELGYDSPSAPSGTLDLLARLRKQAGYKEPAIKEQARRLIDIMSDARSGKIKAVMQKLVDFENSPYAWGIQLGQISPSLFALDSRLMIINKRIIQSFKQMSMSVLGKTSSLPTKLSKYQYSMDELNRFQSHLASSYDFQEVLDNHWLNLFFSKSFEWKFRAKRRYSSLARQMDSAKRKKIELYAMNFAIKEEEALGRKCTDVSSTESFDILSTDQLNQDPRFVEVKGHSGNDRTAWLTQNEYELALRERDKYILYIVYNIDRGTPAHRRIVNPVTKMKVETKVTLSYFLS